MGWAQTQDMVRDPVTGQSISRNEFARRYPGRPQPRFGEGKPVYGPGDIGGRHTNTFEMKERIRRTQQRMIDISSTSADHTEIQGRFPVNNIGEGREPIMFPVAFSTVPHMSFGFEIQGDTRHIIKGHAPSITAAVCDWSVRERPPTSRLFLGAEVIIVATGPPNTRFIVHWTAKGTGFMAPLE